MNGKTIYTHDIAAGIVDRFEDVLVETDICLPSPDDDDRPEEDNAGLYGKLVDTVEEVLLELIEKARDGSTGTYDIISGIYGGKYYEEWYRNKINCNEDQRICR